MILWKSSISYTCSDCKQSGNETFYDTTTFSIDPHGNNSPVWTAPSSQMINVTANSIPSALGIPTDAASLMQSIVDRTVAKNVPKSMIDQRAFNNIPKKPKNPKHVCE